mmetsp:Transcript_8972/g.31680  ORF Transcript_8972/g.31680 Transcript_8972/m.31680 type:complete len:287 (-) Transcript_8972:338-1198(-)
MIPNRVLRVVRAVHAARKHHGLLLARELDGADAVALRQPPERVHVGVEVGEVALHRRGLARRVVRHHLPLRVLHDLGQREAARPQVVRVEVRVRIHRQPLVLACRVAERILAARRGLRDFGHELRPALARLRQLRVDGDAVALVGGRVVVVRLVDELSAVRDGVDVADVLARIHADGQVVHRLVPEADLRVQAQVHDARPLIPGGRDLVAHDQDLPVGQRRKRLDSVRHLVDRRDNDPPLGHQIGMRVDPLAGIGPRRLPDRQLDAHGVLVGVVAAQGAAAGAALA